VAFNSSGEVVGWTRKVGPTAGGAVTATSWLTIRAIYGDDNDAKLPNSTFFHLS